MKKINSLNIEPITFYVDGKENWVPFEVVRMRYEKFFSDLTEVEVMEMRKTYARWIYTDGQSKERVLLKEKDKQHFYRSDYRVIANDQGKRYLFLKNVKSKLIEKAGVIENPKELRPYQENAIYFTIQSSEKLHVIAMVLITENGSKIEKKIFKAYYEKPIDSFSFLYKAIEKCLQIAKEKKLEKIHLYTDKIQDKKRLVSLFKKIGEPKSKNLKTIYFKIKEVVNEFKDYRYTVVTRNQNKTAKEMTQKEINQYKEILREKKIEQKRKELDQLLKKYPHHEYISFVDASTNNHKKSSRISGILYNKKGEEITKYSKKWEYTKNTTWLEMMALKEMVDIIKKEKRIGVILCTDCEGAQQYANGKPANTKKQQKYEKFGKEMKENPHIVVLKIDRLMNQEAHLLAKHP